MTRSARARRRCRRRSSRARAPRRAPAPCDPLADRPALRRRERRDRPAQQRQDVVERVGRQSRDPARRAASNRPSSWSRIVPLSRRKPSTQPAPTAGSAPGDSARRIRRVASALSSDALVEEQPARPAGDEPVEAVLVDEAAERLPPRRAVVGVVEQRDRAVDAIDQPRRSRAAASSSSEAAAAARPTQIRATSPSTTPATAVASVPADVAVAQDAGERRQRVHQRRHVRADRGHVADPLDDDARPPRGRSARRTASISSVSGGQPRRRRSRASIADRRGRLLDRVAEPAGGDEVDDELGLPGERPDLVERAALAADLARGRPHVDAEESRAGGAGGSGRGRSRSAGRGRSSSGRAPASCGAGASRARGRRRAARRAHRAAISPMTRPTISRSRTSRERQVRAEREAGADRLVELRERRHGAAAHRGERLGEAGGLDEVGRRGVEALLAEERARPGPSTRRRAARRPTRGARTSRATRCRRRSPDSAARRSYVHGTHAAAVFIGLRQGLEDAIVRRRRGGSVCERGRVPRAADDGDVREALLRRLADPAAHRRLALERERVLSGSGARGRAAIASRDRGEQVAGVAPRLDQAVPEPLAVLLAGGLGELGRAGRCRIELGEVGRPVVGSPARRLGVVGAPRLRLAAAPPAALELRLRDRELDARGEVDEPDRRRRARAPSASPPTPG